MTTLIDYDFGPDARNRLSEAGERGEQGAVAALETFYYALNNAELDTLSAVWADDDLVQLDNPVGGILRSRAAVTDLYRRIFASGIDVQVSFTDAATYLSDDTAVFAGREIGSYRDANDERVPLEIRTTRILQLATRLIAVGAAASPRQHRQSRSARRVPDRGAASQYERGRPHQSVKPRWHAARTEQFDRA